MIFVAIAVLAGIVVVSVAVWVFSRRKTAPAPVVEDEPVDTSPMTGLESALAQVKDRSGRPIGERIEAEHVDDLRVPDDTGPLLRRALDHVTPSVDRSTDPATVAAQADDENA